MWVKRLWCILWHRAHWHRHDVLRALAICSRCSEIYEVANGYLATDHQVPYLLGTEALDIPPYQPTAMGAPGSRQAVKEGWGQRG